MKRIILTVSIFAVSLCMLLCGCDRVTSETSYNVSKSETTDFTTDTLVSSGASFKTALSEKSTDELLNGQSTAIFCNDTPLESFLNTPTSLLLGQRSSPVPVAYDKISGEFALSCRDPLCEHWNCVWNTHWIYSFGENLYFVNNENEITKADMQGNDGAVLYTAKEQPFDLKVMDNYLYFQEGTVDTETNKAVHQIKRIALSGGKAEILVSYTSDSSYLRYLPVGDGNIMYSVTGGKTYFLEGEAKTEMGEGIVLNLYCDGYVYYSTDEGNFVSPVGVTLSGTPLPENMTDIQCVYGGRVYFFRAEKTENSFLKRDLYSCKIDGTDVIFEREFITDGKHDNVFAVSVTAQLLCVVYRTYEDEQNEERFMRFSLIDTESGERFDWKNSEG